MQKYKHIQIVVLVIFIFIMLFMFYKKNILSDTGVNENDMSLQLQRIPKLEEGVNVHELENEIFNILGPENVAISTDRSSASGILWSYDGKEIIVVTTKHFMQNFEQGEIEFWTGEKVSFDGTQVKTMDVSDVAIIHIACEKKLKQTKGGVKSWIVEETPELGNSVWIIDSVYGAASGISSSMVASSPIFLEDYGTEMLLLFGEGKEGMSGSPVYDENGKLVAMMSGMSDDGTMMAAVPMEEIRKIFEILEE